MRDRFKVMIGLMVFSGVVVFGIVGMGVVDNVEAQDSNEGIYYNPVDLIVNEFDSGPEGGPVGESDATINDIIDYSRGIQSTDENISSDISFYFEDRTNVTVDEFDENPDIGERAISFSLKTQANSTLMIFGAVNTPTDAEHARVFKNGNYWKLMRPEEDTGDGENLFEANDLEDPYPLKDTFSFQSSATGIEGYEVISVVYKGGTVQMCDDTSYSLNSDGYIESVNDADAFQECIENDQFLDYLDISSDGSVNVNIDINETEIVEVNNTEVNINQTVNIEDIGNITLNETGDLGTFDLNMSNITGYTRAYIDENISAQNVTVKPKYEGNYSVDEYTDFNFTSENFTSNDSKKYFDVDEYNLTKVNITDKEIFEHTTTPIFPNVKEIDYISNITNETVLDYNTTSNESYQGIFEGYQEIEVEGTEFNETCRLEPDDENGTDGVVGGSCFNSYTIDSMPTELDNVERFEVINATLNNTETFVLHNNLTYNGTNFSLIDIQNGSTINNTIVNVTNITNVTSTKWETCDTHIQRPGGEGESQSIVINGHEVTLYPNKVKVDGYGEYPYPSGNETTELPDNLGEEAGIVETGLWVYGCGYLVADGISDEVELPSGTNVTGIENVTVINNITKFNNQTIYNYSNRTIERGNIDYSVVANQIYKNVTTSIEPFGIVNDTLDDIPESPEPVTGFTVDPDFNESKVTVRNLDRGSANDYGDTVAEYSLDAPQGSTVEVQIDNLSEYRDYQVFQDGEEWKTVSSGNDGSIQIVKLSGWSIHNFTVVTSSTNSGPSNVDDGDDDSPINIGLSDTQAPDTLLVVLGLLSLVVAYMIYRWRQNNNEDDIE